MSSDLGSLLMAAVLGALASSVIFATLWVAWLRRMQKQLKQIERLMYNKPIPPARPTPMESAAAFASNVMTKKPELVAQFKVKDGQQTVSVMESDGKRFLRVDGDLSWKQRLQMLRYLKSEGFMD
ncbi:MAG: hypothetical protein B9S32_01205 [Verrucomicrobia bacterium Tous-C9LFEB]|nr:MAG: hypothetical protein B9S32_01205 [Verrucomicrobia bacterium Tous-C9LFEB]